MTSATNETAAATKPSDAARSYNASLHRRRKSPLALSANRSSPVTGELEGEFAARADSSDDERD